MNTFSVDEYLSGGIDETVIVHRPAGRLCWDHVTWSWGWCSDLDRYVLTIWDPMGFSVIGTQLFKKGEHVFERCTDPSVIVTAV
jgi:hypothetical protein|nr:MAG TPA: hypothetical protein [Caudoviricetes sp.]